MTLLARVASVSALSVSATRHDLLVTTTSRMGEASRTWVDPSDHQQEDLNALEDPETAVDVDLCCPG